MTEPFLNVSERFHSIQGESTRAGLPCLFLRTAGCNLRCVYCDSRYTWEEEGHRMALEDILQWVDEYPRTMVELTGGEPLLQDASYPLMDCLLKKGRAVLVETNGSILIDRVPDEAVVILDIKCPGSGMEDSNNRDNLGLLLERSRRGSRDEIKFVLSSEDDFLFAKDMVARYGLDNFVAVLFSPNEQSFRAARLAELILRHRLQVRLQLQLHRILWPGTDRGV